MPTSRCLHLAAATALLLLLLPWRIAAEGSKGGALAGLHIAIDVGHSVSRPGALSARGQGEFLFNQSTARVIAEVVRSAGAKVTVVNEKGTMTGLTERTQAAVQAKADAFLSIHHDSANDKYMETWEHEGKKLVFCDRFSGYSVFCSKKNLRAAESRALAIEIGSAMLAAGFKPTPHHNEAIQGENRPFIDARTGVYEYTDLVVAKSGKLPSVLLECGVIVNREEELLVQTKEYQQRIGHAVVAALVAARQKELIGAGPDKGEPQVEEISPQPGGSLIGVQPTRKDAPESHPAAPAESPSEPESKRKGLSRLLPGKKE